MPTKYVQEKKYARDVVAQTPGIISVALTKDLMKKFGHTYSQMSSLISSMYDRHELFPLRAVGEYAGLYEVYACVPPTNDPSRLVRKTRKSPKAKPNGYGSVIPKMSAQLALDVVPAGGTLHVHTGARPECPDNPLDIPPPLPPITGHFTVPLEQPQPRSGLYITLELRGTVPIRLSLDEARKVYDQLATLFHPQR